MSDLISRKAVLEEIKKNECEPGYQHVGEDWAVGLIIAENIVESAESIESTPSAEPERKKGEWIIRYYDDKSYETKEVNYNPFSLSNPCGIAYCSECGAPPLLNGHEEDVYSKYCPNCGCKMDWSDDE